jgi:hypothetical protein
MINTEKKQPLTTRAASVNMGSERSLHSEPVAIIYTVYAKGPRLRGAFLIGWLCSVAKSVRIGGPQCGDPRLEQQRFIPAKSDNDQSGALAAAISPCRVECPQ